MAEILLGKSSKEKEFKKAMYFSKDLRDRKRAIGLFKMALDDPNYRVQSVNSLVDLYIKIGDYLHAREILNDFGSEENMLALAKLENVENNYQTSKNCYQKISDVNEEQRVQLSLARIEFRLGNYKEGREILEHLKCDSRYKLQCLFEECFSYMMEHNYEKGAEILKHIKTSKFKPEQASDYEAMKIYFSYFLEMMDEQEIESHFNDGYWIFRLLRDSDNALLKHISHHKEGNQDAGLCPFINCLDLRRLLDEARERIPSLNPNYLHVVEFYAFHLNRPIGYVDGELTDSVCVTTILGTDKILTMYPVLLSEKFDREGNSTSERLKRKRELSRKF